MKGNQWKNNVKHGYGLSSKKKDTETKPGDENPANFVDVEALAKIIKANELDDEVRSILAKSAKAA